MKPYIWDREMRKAFPVEIISQTDKTAVVNVIWPKSGRIHEVSKRIRLTSIYWK